MADTLTRFRFHVHRAAPAWRLVTPAGHVPPSELVLEDWAFTRERESADTNPDVKAICLRDGYCLFKVGGTLADVARDLAHKSTDGLPPLAAI